MLRSALAARKLFLDFRIHIPPVRLSTTKTRLAGPRDMCYCAYESLPISLLKQKDISLAADISKIPAQSTESIYLLAVYHRSTMLRSLYTRPTYLDLYIPLVSKDQPHIAWTTALHFSGSHVCNCLLSPIAYGTPSWAKIEPTVSQGTLLSRSAFLSLASKGVWRVEGV